MLDTAPISAAIPAFRTALAEAALPIEDIDEPGRTFLRFEVDGRTVGYGGYELHGEDALIRSVVVLPGERGRGFGRAVTEAVLDHAARAGARRAYLLTTTAEPFFARSGFRTMPRAEAPAAILATRQAATICATAALLVRPLLAP